MSDVGPEGRSYRPIERRHLERLLEIARADRDQFFCRHRDWAIYADRVVATALCQGAALHYLRGEVGVHDFDVYTFFAAHRARRWYAKRNKPMDFGLPDFGQSPDRPHFVGRRVDLLGRGINVSTREDPAVAIRRWLVISPTRSAHYLRQKAVVLLEPVDRMGERVWPEHPQ